MNDSGVVTGRDDVEAASRLPSAAESSAPGLPEQAVRQIDFIDLSTLELSEQFNDYFAASGYINSVIKTYELDDDDNFGIGLLDLLDDDDDDVDDPGTIGTSTTSTSSSISSTLDDLQVRCVDLDYRLLDDELLQACLEGPSTPARCLDGLSLRLRELGVS